MDDLVDETLTVRAGGVGAAEAAVRLGAEMPHLPRRPLPLHRRHHRPGGPLQPGGIGLNLGGSPLLEGGGEHGPHLVGAAEHLQCLRSPSGALVGEAAWFVFGVAGLEGGALCELDGFDRGRRPALRVLEGGGELALPGLDRLPARRPPGVECRVDANDLADRPFPRVRVGPLGEPHAQPRC